MLHPVGDLAPSVYWRRRAILLAALLLAGVSCYAIFFRGGGDAPAGGGGFAASAGSRPVSSSSAPQTDSGSPASTSTAAQACPMSQLAITAATSAGSYPAGAKPTVAIVVTNKGPAACVQDLSDGQIELRVYNGSARVWGSHDCAIQPGTAPATLPVGQPIRREIEWSGLSSRPACAGTRTRVPAGRYTLFAYLAGHQGSTTTFTLAG
ncbi:MAG TPA: hypothetical protein VFU36_06750 [Jatrophihabitans sp.]|nr:hypothetical protein [Jatrophihabitans sp.]